MMFSDATITTNVSTILTCLYTVMFKHIIIIIIIMEVRYFQPVSKDI